MAVEIDFKKSEVRVSFTLPSTAGSEVSKKIVAVKAALDELLKTRKETTKADDAAQAEVGAALDAAYASMLAAMTDKTAESGSVVAAIDDVARQLREAVEVVSTTPDEANILAEAEARKASIDTERDRKIAAIPVIVKG